LNLIFKGRIAELVNHLREQRLDKKLATFALDGKSRATMMKGIFFI
jgi:hypothetical protein